MLLFGSAPLLGVCGYIIHAESQCFGWNLIHGLMISWSAYVGLVNIPGWMASNVVIHMIDVLKYI